MHKDDLYYQNTRNHEITLVQTVQKNDEEYSQHQIQDAKKACDFYAKVGYTSVRDFKTIISKNLNLNCPMTASVVVRADKIYGQDILSLKGKITRTKPKPLVIDYLVMPKNILENNKKITLSIDIMFVNKIMFITTINRHIKFTTVEAIQKRIKLQLSESIKNVIAFYTQRGFKVEHALLDG